MIINFTIKNYRSIRDEVTLSFEATNTNDLENYYVVTPRKGLRLLKVGLIYGANASGKTTILQALDFVRNLVLEPFDNKTRTFEFEPFLFDDTSKHENTFFTLEFVQNSVKYHYQVEINKEAIISEELRFHNPNKALLYKRTTDTTKQFSHIEFGPKLKISKEQKVFLEGNTLWNNTVLGGYLKSNFESIELQNAVDWFQNRLNSTISPRSLIFPTISNMIENKKLNKENVIQILKKADFGISDIIIKDEGKMVDENLLNLIKNNSKNLHTKNGEVLEIQKVETRSLFLQHSLNGKHYILPMSQESAGTQRYYEFSGLLSLLINGNNILAIDELESSLHPDLVKHFLLTFLVNSKESQLIATTHYRELLMDKDILRNDAIWFTEKKENCSTDLFSLSDFDSSVVRNTSSIYNAYKIGKLGAVPDLKDYYIEFEDGEK